MSHLPRHIILFGRLRRDKTFQGIDSKLDTEERKRKIYPILSSRFWCHAHIYSPVLSLIFYYIIGEDLANEDLIKTALPLLMASLGSLSFALCDSYGGAYADKNGCTSAIRLGIKLMIGLMLFFGAITYFNQQLSFTVVTAGRFDLTLFIIFWALGQIAVGLPLALIDGADTELTKKTARTLGGLSKDEGETVGDLLEGICTKLKYAGIALTSFIGCFLFIVVPTWLKDGVSGKAVVGTSTFLLTAVSQAFALRQLRRVQEPELLGPPLEEGAAGGVEKKETAFASFRSALRDIYEDKVLFTWILLIAVTEGWLLFATYYFQLHALKDLIWNSDGYPILLFIIPFLYFILSQIASLGGSRFNTWHQKAAEAAKHEGGGTVQLPLPFDEEQRVKLAAECEEGSTIKLRRGSVIDIPYVRLIAAGAILLIMVGGFILHFAVAKYFPQGVQTEGPQGVQTRGPRGYLLSLIPLCFFAGYQFLRGFAGPLLKTTLSNMAKRRSLRYPTTTLSIATAGGRAFHAISATVFMVCLALSASNADIKKAPTTTGALTATVLILILTTLILNVILGRALDRKNVDRSETAHRPILKDVLSISRNRAFRSNVIKGSFFVCLAMSNILALKLSTVGFLTFNVGAIPYALSFMLVETVAETEGKASSRRLWLAGICTYFVVGLLVVIAVMLWPAEGQKFQAVFDRLFGVGATNFVTAYNAMFRQCIVFIIASLCSFTVAQYLDIWFFLLLKRITRDRALWLRSNLSTFFAQAVDTVIFIGIGFGVTSLSLWETSLSRWEFATLVMGQLGMKWVFSLGYTLLLYPAVWWIEKGKEPELTGASAY